jgi:hypothetical protein
MSFQATDYGRQQLAKLDKEISTILDSWEYRDLTYDCIRSNPSLSDQVRCQVMKDKLDEFRKDKALWHQTIGMSHSTTIHNHCNHNAAPKDNALKNKEHSGWE